MPRHRGCVSNCERSDRVRSSFVEDPRIPLDNNAAERALRGPFVGRKNHYGSRSLRGNEVVAACYTLCETARLVGSIRVHIFCVPSTRQSADPGRLRSLKTCSRQP